MHHHRVENITIKEGAALLAKEVMVFWEKARIPTQPNDQVAEKVKKLFLEWANLKKNKANTKKRSKTLAQKKRPF